MQPRRKPVDPADAHLWEALEEECERIANDPEMLETYKKWANPGKGKWPGPISPIIVAKQKAYSDIMLGGTVAKKCRELLLKMKGK